MTILALSTAASAGMTTLAVTIRVIPDNALMADDGSTPLNADDDTTILMDQ